MYDRLRDLLIGEQGDPALRSRNETRDKLMRRSARQKRSTLRGGASGQPSTDDAYAVANAQNRVYGLPATQPKKATATAKGKATTITIK